MRKLTAIGVIATFVIACGSAKPKTTAVDTTKPPDETATTEETPAESTPAETPAEKPKPKKTVAAACTNVKLAKVPAATKAEPPDPVASSGSGQFAGNAGQRVVGMQDLEALAKGKQWRELVYRASDVPPSKRNKRWDALVTQGATNYLEQLVKKEESYEAMSFAEAAVEAFPILRKATEFMTQRAKVVIDGAEECFKRACSRSSGCETLDEWGGERCNKALMAAVEADPMNHELAKSAGTIVYNHVRQKWYAAQYFRYAVIGRTDAAECSSEELQNSTLWALRTKQDGQAAIAAREVAARWCWNAFTKSLPEQVTAEDPYGILESGCAVLKERGAY
jgi:hypothetical protein